MGDEKLIIITVAVRGINDHIRPYKTIYDHIMTIYHYSQMLCRAAINTAMIVFR